QAEDGIRDFHVTGVQTCALPISPGCGAREPSTRHSLKWQESHKAPDWNRRVDRRLIRRGVATPPWAGNGSSDAVHPPLSRRRNEIGRASCRERVEAAGAAVRATR